MFFLLESLLLLPMSKNMKVALPAHTAASGCLAQEDTDQLAGAAFSQVHPSEFWQSAVSGFPRLETACTACLRETQSGPEYLCHCSHTQIHSKRSLPKEV